MKLQKLLIFIFSKVIFNLLLLTDFRHWKSILNRPEKLFVCKLIVPKLSSRFASGKYANIWAAQRWYLYFSTEKRAAWRRKVWRENSSFFSRVGAVITTYCSCFHFVFLNFCVICTNFFCIFRLHLSLC